MMSVTNCYKKEIKKVIYLCKLQGIKTVEKTVEKILPNVNDVKPYFKPKNMQQERKVVLGVIHKTGYIHEVYISYQSEYKGIANILPGKVDFYQRIFDLGTKFSYFLRRR